MDFAIAVLVQRTANSAKWAVVSKTPKQLSKDLRHRKTVKVI